MIRKTDENLLNWIYEHIIDFTDENDTSGLTWESSRVDAAKFLHSIPQKERVQKYGFCSGHAHFYLTDSFADIEEGLEKGFISEGTCRIIYNWKREVRRETWNMEDVLEVLYPETPEDERIRPLYPSVDFRNLLEMGLLEWVTTEDENEKIVRVTEKAKAMFGEF
ncbi:MAG: hypothetical protein Q4Q18_07445 [Methanobrevibacter sp.]|nr:hypothetical protein [Methanobrevibacter sp.]